jgi:hypothetical protein
MVTKPSSKRRTFVHGDVATSAEQAMGSGATGPNQHTTG